MKGRTIGKKGHLCMVGSVVLKLGVPKRVEIVEALGGTRVPRKQIKACHNEMFAEATNLIMFYNLPLQRQRHREKDPGAPVDTLASLAS